MASWQPTSLPVSCQVRLSGNCEDSDHNNQLAIITNIIIVIIEVIIIAVIVTVRGRVMKE